MSEYNHHPETRNEAIRSVFSAEDLLPSTRAKEAFFRDWVAKRVAAGGAAALALIFIFNATRGVYEDEKTPAPAPPPPVELSPTPSSSSTAYGGPPTETGGGMSYEDHEPDATIDPLSFALDSMTKTLE